MTKYNKFDIVQSTPDYGSKVYVILEVRPRGGYVGKAFHGQCKQFRLSEDSLSCKIGTAEPDSPFITGTDEDGSAVNPDFDAGQQFASLKATFDTVHADRWKFLAGLSFGDNFRLADGSTVTYEGCKRTRPKYPVSYAKNGKRYKGAIAMVMVP